VLRQGLNRSFLDVELALCNRSARRIVHATETAAALGDR